MLKWHISTYYSAVKCSNPNANIEMFNFFSLALIFCSLLGFFFGGGNCAVPTVLKHICKVNTLQNDVYTDFV